MYMFAEERHQKIKQMIVEYRRVDVATLAKFFSISEVTARKDLIKLEKDGFLIRTHGGAVVNQKSRSVEKYAEPEGGPDIERKAKIGGLLNGLIKSGDMIFLGPGTTCTHAARILRSKESLHVITTNISGAIELSKNPDIITMLVGGHLSRRGSNYTTIDVEAVEYLKTKYADKCIITVDGISAKSGFTVHNDMVARTYQPILKNSTEKIVIATSDKFNKNAFSHLGDLSSIDILITDKDAPPESVELLEKHGVKVYMTD